jgi:hypothetical protein
MSHLVLRLGHLFHFHVPACGSPARSSTPEGVAGGAAPAGNVARGHALPPDDLSFFSLSVERPARDRRADLDRLGLIGLGDLAEID